MKDRAAATLKSQLPIQLQRWRDSGPRGRAAQRLADFLPRSPTYAAGRGRPGAGDVVSHNGLTWRIPPSLGEDGFAAKLRAGWLPTGEILSSRRMACGGLMLDLGANVGTTSIPRVILGDFEAVYAAEPEPANYAALVENVQVNGVEGCVLPDRVAIGAEDGTSPFVLRPGIARHGLPGTIGPMSDETDPRIEVEVRRLDTWVAGLGLDPKQISFIKSDCQGADGAVLAGAPRLLTERHIVWQVEIWPKAMAGTPYTLEATVELIRASFTHCIDYRRGAGEPMPTNKLAKSLAYFSEMPTTYTELYLYNSAV